MKHNHLEAYRDLINHIIFIKALFALATVALARPADDAAAVAPLVYGLPYGAAAG